jgi:hypothetical protein
MTLAGQRFRSGPLAVPAAAGQSGKTMLEDALSQIAKNLLAMDEDALISLIPKYRKRMDRFEPTTEWEESVIIYFIINGCRIKNAQFNNKIRDYMEELKNKEPKDGFAVSRPDLRLVK